MPPSPAPPPTGSLTLAEVVTEFSAASPELPGAFYEVRNLFEVLMVCSWGRHAACFSKFAASAAATDIACVPAGQ